MNMCSRVNSLPNKLVKVLVSCALLVSFLPLTSMDANAEEVNKRPLMTLGTSVVHGGAEGGVVGDTVYFANYDSNDDDIDNAEALQWRVLDASNDYDDNTAGLQEGIFLLSEYVIDSGLAKETTGAVYMRKLISNNNGKVQFDASGVSYTGSNLQSWNTSFLENNFSDSEQAAVAATYHKDRLNSINEFLDERFYEGLSAVDLKGDKLFAPSAMELYTESYGFSSVAEGAKSNTRIAYLIDKRLEEWPDVNPRSYTASYWTRSYSTTTENAIDVSGTDSLYPIEANVSSRQGARPAFNLKTESVLFTSQAAGGKTTTLQASDSSTWPKIATGATGGWKFTLLDDTNEHLSVSDVSRSGNTVTISYTGATTGKNQYLSAMIVNPGKGGKSDSLISYAPLAKLTSADAYSGKITLTLPSDFDANGYELRLFNEQCNGDYQTDYASSPVTVAPTNASASFLSFEIAGQVGESVIDEATSSIYVALPLGTDVSSLVPSFTASTQASVYVGSVAQESGKTANNFTGALTYSVYAPDKTLRAWTVKVTAGGSSAKDITSFSVAGQVGESVIDTQAHTVSAFMPYGSDLSELSPAISVSENATISPGTGIRQDFSAPYTYTVRAQDGSVETWTVTLSCVSPLTGKDIVSFSVPGEASEAHIDSVAHSVTVYFPYGSATSAKTRVLPSIEVSEGARISPASGRYVDLSTQKTYTVYAQDGTWQDWTVSSVNLPNEECAITSFTINGIAGEIDSENHTVKVSLPYTKDTDPQGRCYTAQLSVSPDASVDPQSGTVQDFSQPVTYTVRAQSGKTQEWVVSVSTLPLSSDSRLTSFSVNGYDAEINDKTQEVHLTLPHGTDLTSLAPVFSLSDAAGRAEVAGVAQTSATSRLDFTNAVEYNIISESGNSRTYTVYLTCEPSVWTRLAGDTRYDTANLIAAEAYGEDGCDTAIIVYGGNFPDALSASQLAGVYDCPILLTDTAELSSAAADALRTLKVTRVFIVGGTGVVSTSVETQVRDIVGYGQGQVQRVAGETRYGTCMQVYYTASAALSTTSTAASDTAIICNGTSFADALSIAPYAFASKSPLFLTNAAGTLDDTMKKTILASGVKNILIVGGTSVVGDAVMTQLGNGFTYERLSGDDRYATSAQVASWETLSMEKAAFQPTVELSYNNCACATGKNFPDALAGGALCGHKGSVLMLVDDGTYQGLINVNETISSNKLLIDNGYYLGGESAISSALQKKIYRASNL